MDVQDKIAAVHRYVEAFDKADLDVIRALFAADAVLEDPVGTDRHVGIEAICVFYRNAFAMGAKLELSGAPRCAGAAVAFPFIVHAGEMKIEAIDVFEFDSDGRVASMKAYWGPENAR